MKRRFLTKAHRNSERGSSTFEASLGLGIVLSVVFLAVSLLILAFRMATIQYVLIRTTRQDLAADRIVSSNSAITLVTDIVSASAKFGVKVDPALVHVCPSSNLACLTPTLGGAELTKVWVDMSLPALPAGFVKNFQPSVLAMQEG